MTEMEWPKTREYQPNIDAIIKDIKEHEEDLYYQLTSHPLSTIKEEYIEDYLK